MTLGRTDDSGEPINECATCDDATRVARLCPKPLRSWDAFKFATGQTPAGSTWAQRRDWLTSWISDRQDPDHEARWAPKGEDRNAAFTLLTWLNGRAADELDNIIYPPHIDPVRTCPVLLIEQDIWDHMDRVVYAGDGQILPWVDGGLSAQPQWWIDTMHAVRRGVAELHQIRLDKMRSSNG